MIWIYFYNINSASEHGTLCQLQNEINHTNVVKNPKCNYNACGDFLETVAVGHVLGAAMKILEIPNLNNQLSDVAVGITSTERVLDCWQYLLPMFHNSGEIILIRLFFLCQYYYDLSQQLYSTFVNNKGVRGRNIPLDLYQEHLNRLCKECVKGLGSNKIKVSIVRYSKALGILEEMLDNSDEHNNVSIPSSVHQALSSPGCAINN